MSVARNIIKNPKLVPGGGATELTVSAALKQKSSSIEGIEKVSMTLLFLLFEDHLIVAYLLSFFKKNHICWPKS